MKAAGCDINRFLPAEYQRLYRKLWVRKSGNIGRKIFHSTKLKTFSTQTPMIGGRTFLRCFDKALKIIFTQTFSKETGLQF